MERLQERRMNDRLLCAELVELVWSDGRGREIHRVGNLEDISRSGICLQMESRVAAGVRVIMRHGRGRQLVGTVRHSSYRDGAYFIGVQLDEGSRWRTECFRPKHLWDPKESLTEGHGGVMQRAGAPKG